MTAAQLTRRYVVLRGLRWMPLGILLPFIILLPQARGLSLGTIGALWAVHSVVALLLEVPSGALADGYGRRRSLLAGATLLVLALVAYAFAAAPLAFAAALTGLAAGRALISGALEAWFVDTLRTIEPEGALRRGLSLGAAADGAGLMVGALAGGFLPLAFDGLPRTGGGTIFYTPVVLIAAGLAVGYLIAVAVLVVEAPRTVAAVPARDRLREIVLTARVAVRASPVLRTVLVTAAAFGIVLTSVELLWQPRLAELLGDADDHTVLFGTLVAGSMGMLSLCAALSPRVMGPLGARRGYAAVVAASAASLGVLAAANSPIAFVVAFLAVYGVLGLGDPVHFELLHEATTDDVRATMMSAEALAQQAGGGAGNLGLGLVAGAAGMPLAWLVAGSLLAATLVLVLRLPRTELTAADRLHGLAAS